MSRLGLKFMFFFLMLTLSYRADSGVNANNGNFFIAYTTFLLSTGALNIEITDTYNSRSSFVRGSKGVGWSTELDGYLKTAQKDLQYFEGGGGNVLLFKKAKTNQWINSSYGKQGIEKVQLSEKNKARYDRIFVSSLGKGKLKTFFKMSHVSGRKYYFNDFGKMIRIEDANKNYINMVYDAKTGLLSRLQDNNNNQVHYKWKDFGKLPRVVLIQKDEYKARYYYNDQGDLIKIKGMDGVPYAFKYDDEHNMTEISYANGSSRKMKYNKVRDWVTYYKDIDGVETSYNYYSDALDPENKFGTSLVRNYPQAKKKEEAKFWYEFRRRNDGSRYNYRTVSSLNNVVTETIYTSCCGTPLNISQWMSDSKKKYKKDDVSWTRTSGKKYITKFEYYPNGTLKKKRLPNGQLIEISYDNVTKKVASIKRDGKKLSYQYDRSANLSTAVDHALNKQMDFVYDLQGRVKKIDELQLGSQNKPRSIFFRYNSLGQAVEVKERLGSGKEASITISYDAKGRVKEIQNAQGRTVASQSEVATTRRIYETFENLIRIVKPPSIGLNVEGAI